MCGWESIQNPCSTTMRGRCCRRSHTVVNTPSDRLHPQVPTSLKDHAMGQFFTVKPGAPNGSRSVGAGRRSISAQEGLGRCVSRN